MRKILFVPFLLCLCTPAYAVDTIVYGAPSGVSAGDATHRNLNAASPLGVNTVTIDASCTGWTLGAGWACGGDGTIVKSSDGTGTAAYNASEAAATDYQVEYTLASLSGGTIWLSVGGITDVRRSSNGSYTFHVSTTGTGDTTFSVSATGVRVTISSVSVMTKSNGDVTADGDVNVRRQVLANTGNSAYPSYSFTENPDTGLYLQQSDTTYIIWAIDNSPKMKMYQSTTCLATNNASLRIGASCDAGLFRDAANVLQIGPDGGPASDQTLKAADSTGAGQDGASLTLKGGNPGAGGAAGVVKIPGQGSAGKVMCWKADAETLGYCSDAPDVNGDCTCN